MQSAVPLAVPSPASHSVSEHYARPTQLRIKLPANCRSGPEHGSRGLPELHLVTIFGKAASTQFSKKSTFARKRGFAVRGLALSRGALRRDTWYANLERRGRRLRTEVRSGIARCQLQSAVPLAVPSPASHSVSEHYARPTQLRIKLPANCRSRPEHGSPGLPELHLVTIFGKAASKQFSR